MGQGFSSGVRGGVLISYFMGISTGHASETTSLAVCMGGGALRQWVVGRLSELDGQPSATT
jgi:hypothetical protein